MSRTSAHDCNEPVEFDELTALRASMPVPEPELAILMRRGVSFNYVAQSLGAAAFWALLAIAFVWMGLLSGTVKEPVPDFPIVSSVVALAGFAGLGWLWIDRLRRNARIVMGNDGLSLWQGQSRVRTVTWDALGGVRKVWPGVALISARNGSTIWITSSVQQYDFLVAFAQWILPIDRSTRSLRAIIESALRSGVRFRASTIAAPLGLVFGLFFLGLAFSAAWEIALDDEWDVDTLWGSAGAILFMALSCGSSWLAWTSYVARNDQILIRVDGVEGRTHSGVTFISWTEATHPEALRALEHEDNTAFVRDASGQKEIDGVMRFDEVLLMLLQYMLVRHLSEREWKGLRSLDQLKL